MKYANRISWHKQKLEKPVQVVCSLDHPPHFLTLEELTMISIDDAPALPYAFCPQHKAYFGISSDVNMEGMVLRLDETPLTDIEEEKKHAGQ